MTVDLMKKAPAGWDEGLSDGERLFLQEYFVDLNGTKAAQRAGYSPENAKAAAVQSCEMLKRPQVKAARDKLFEKHGISRLRILEEMAKVAFANIGDYVKIEGGSLVVTNFDELSDDQISALGEVSETITEFGTTIKVKPYDKLTALAWLGKASRLFVERTELSGPNGGPIPVEDTTAAVRARIMARLDKMAKLAGEDAKLIEGVATEAEPAKDKA